MRRSLAKDAWIKSPCSTSAGSSDSAGEYSLDNPKNCFVCADIFQGLKIKHNCRHCGNAICGNCSERLTFKFNDAVEYRRICSVCKQDKKVADQISVAYTASLSSSIRSWFVASPSSKDQTNSCGFKEEDTVARGGEEAGCTQLTQPGTPIGTSIKSNDNIPSPMTPYKSADAYQGTPAHAVGGESSSSVAGVSTESIGIDTTATWTEMDSSKHSPMSSLTSATSRKKRIAIEDTGSPQLGVRARVAASPVSAMSTLTANHRGSDAATVAASSPPRTILAHAKATQVAGGHLVDFSVDILPSDDYSTVVAGIDHPTSAAKTHGSTFNVIAIDSKDKRKGSGSHLWVFIFVAYVAAIILSTSSGRCWLCSSLRLSPATMHKLLGQEKEGDAIATIMQPNVVEDQRRKTAEAAKKEAHSAAAALEEKRRKAEVQQQANNAKIEKNAKGKIEKEKIEKELFLQRERNEREAAARAERDKAVKEQKRKEEAAVALKAEKERKAAAAAAAAAQAEKKKIKEAASPAQPRAQNQAQGNGARKAKKIMLDVKSIPNPVVNLSKKGRVSRSLKCSWLEEELSALSAEEKFYIGAL